MRDHNYFEGYARHNKMIPQGYVDTPQGRILLADSEGLIREDGKLFYRTGYGVERGGMDFGNFHDYDPGTDQQTRLNEAVEHARNILAQLDAAGYFDDARRNNFSQ